MRNLGELNINEGGKKISRKPPTDKEIKEFEKEIGVKLPLEYIQLLKYSNGGHPEVDCFVPKGSTPDDTWGVNDFFYLNAEKDRFGNIYYEIGRWRSALGKKAIPFASDGGDNQFFLNFKNNPPSVEILVHDNFRTIKAADTFEEFIDMLTYDPDMI